MVNLGRDKMWVLMKRAGDGEMIVRYSHRFSLDFGRFSGKIAN
jgi:hypothetical protein